MDELVLTPPTMDWEDQILSFKRECLAEDPKLNGVGGLDMYDSVPQWLAFVERKRREETCPPGLVPDSTFLCVRKADQRVVGMVSIRHRLNDFLLIHGGHVGYSIRPDERGKGYAKAQLRLALEKCRQLGLPRVLLTCREDNERSIRTIEGCGGVYADSRAREEEGMVRRYWITLSEE